MRLSYEPVTGRAVDSSYRRLELESHPNVSHLSIVSYIPTLPAEMLARITVWMHQGFGCSFYNLTHVFVE